MFERTQIKERLSKHKAICVCKQCQAEYICNPYDALKSKVGHLCKSCKSQVTSIRNPSSQDLVKVFSYDPESGVLSYRNDSLSGLAGDPAGYAHSQGYLTVRVGGVDLLVHRVIWCMQTGSWPDQVDHMNHDRSDNSWKNLREVGSRENQLNMGKRANNSTGVQGVRKLPSGKFHAYIMVHRKQIALGSYVDIEDATAARKEAEVLYGFHANHGS